ncbi:MULTISPECIES: hypothetical protein [Aliivibrio]|uniref:Uncharacterized protein n=1 Tax=Aliivibrio sifiae TaxID=566293 RepID=A0A2S7X1C1_9GAMM|nr:hypothetical protein [Aliivibrio sifiae]PQJ83558.1 hypothetical protein BTO23_20680 [Aliivibrio sifiae]GLR76807.1 hypothetical protein GCM10007855_36820 [Aliivibrio sifiae]
MSQIDKLSGCEISKIIEGIGYDNLSLFCDKDEFISRLSNEALLDSIVNDNNRDIEMLILQLYSSLLEYPETAANKTKMEAMKKRISLETLYST